MADTAVITVLAGTNGAGKSSVAGAAIRASGGDFYNPDEATAAYLEAGLAPLAANSRAWHRGRTQLERAIRDGLDYALETTLGGQTITRLLLEAASGGHAVRIWYVGLDSPELHIRRVKERVNRSGHDIPEERIRERWDASRENIIRLLPALTELQVYDNSAEAAPEEGRPPNPLRLLHLKSGQIPGLPPLGLIPDWAKSILAAALLEYGDK